MSASDFQEIGASFNAGKAERLFRAAVTAFCSLTRPSRRDAAQLDDLTLPLFDMVSSDSLRYVAAALSECAVVPNGLLQRLCDEPVGVAAPLLIRSSALSSVDLISIIGRHGVEHARTIARRPELDATVAHLITALEVSIAATQPETMPPQKSETSTDALQAFEAGAAAAAMRERLRLILSGPGERIDDDTGAENDLSLAATADPACFAKLRDAALERDPAGFQAVLGNTLTLNADAVRTITEASSVSPLIAALRSLDFAEEQAFVIAAAVFPEKLSSPETIQLFLERYRGLDRTTALDRVRGWKVEMVSDWIKKKSASNETEMPTRRMAVGSSRRLWPEPEFE